jgi:hypothetical protein
MGTEMITEIQIEPMVRMKVFLKAGKTMVLISLPETADVPN